MFLFTASDVSQKLRSALEIGAVVAILMLVITFSRQSHETYILRGQLSEAFSLASVVKTDMALYRAQYGQWPDTDSALGSTRLSQENGLGQYVDQMNLHDDGSITVIFDSDLPISSLAGRRLTFRIMAVPSSPDSPVFWGCASYSAPEGLTPVGNDETDIDAIHLPSPCREY